MTTSFRMIAAAALAGLALSGPALAEKPAKGHGNGWKHGQAAAPAHGTHCPPGLAKKNPPCVPPGLAKKSAGAVVEGDDDGHHHHYVAVGDYIEGNTWVLISDPLRLGLMDGSYVRYGDYVYQVRPDTLEVLALVGLAEKILN